jgi:competence ComEA-like helix-hairpin-helix protein
MQKNHWKEWFVFTKRDRNAATILLAVTGLIILLPYFLPAKKLEIHIDKDLQQELDAYRTDHPLANNTSVNIATKDTAINDTIKKELFFFDPNTLSEEGFLKLGLPQKTVHTLINYRNKGGYFKTPGDISKIYGLSKTQADRLIPYVRITNTKQKKEIKYQQPVSPASTHQYRKININTASVEEWKTFPGIGDVIANRIIKFRASIGGFKSIDQVGKTYGLSDSTFQFIKPYLSLKDSSNANH